MKRKTILLALIILITIISSSFSNAQTYLTTDTLKVGGGYYANDIISVNQGNKRVPVTVYLRNTFNVGGFVTQIAYDTSIMYPYPPAPESSYIQPIRSQNLSFFGCSFDEPGLIRCFGARYIAGQYIAEGRGPIIEFYFNIKTTAQDGYYPVSFEGDVFDNEISDVNGEGD
ncbi:MAG: cohesin domain-containing protein, partial [candidate division Zixibacteria bacterium]|nr:cohesin domain-containing protein [candidate division Zixibacteria bacterium]